MARKFLPYYNVDASVGNGGTNFYEDVLLVQFMLTRIAEKPPHPLPPPSTFLGWDGIATPVLVEWIIWFQKSTKAVGESIIVDGRIDPSHAKEGSFRPPARGRTMSFMNASYRRRYRESHDAMERDNECPTPLRMKFGLVDEVP
jgi:hypothetical protein